MLLKLFIQKINIDCSWDIFYTILYEKVIYDYLSQYLYLLNNKCCDEDVTRLESIFEDKFYYAYIKYEIHSYEFLYVHDFVMHVFLDL